MFNKKLKQELAELREEVATNRQIKESLYREMMVLEIDTQGRIQHPNPSFLSEMGYRLEDLVGRSLDSFFSDEFKKEPNYTSLKNAMPRGEHISGAFRVLQANGKEA
ncbi:PAS domain-containing protein [Pseudomonas sp. SA195]